MEQDKSKVVVDSLKVALDEMLKGVNYFDIGEAVGIVIANHCEKIMLGYEIEDFKAGFDTGLSVVEGTYDPKASFSLTFKPSEDRPTDVGEYLL